MTRDKNNNFLFIGNILLFTMVVLPFLILEIKVVLIVSLVLYSIFHILKIKRFIFIWFIIYIIWGFIFIIYGMYHETKGANSLIGVYLLWPILYFFFIININTLKALSSIVKVLLFSSFIMSIYVILSVFSLKTGMLPASLFFMTREVLDSTVDKVEVFIPFTTSFFFIIPFTLVLVFSKYQIIINKKNLLILLTFNLIAIFFINRNALNLIFILAPIIMYILSKVIFKRVFSFTITIQSLKIFVSIIGIIFLSSLFFMEEIMILVDNFLLGLEFTSSDAVSAYARYNQFFELLHVIEQKPLFGHGLGATIENYTRSVKTPWMFELSYMALIFQVGIIGTIIYLILIFSLIHKLIYIARKDKRFYALAVGTIVGTISFLIANATNPYLYAYDHMWALFAPLAVINVYLHENRKKYNAR